MRDRKQAVLKGKFAYVGYVVPLPDVDNPNGYVQVYKVYNSKASLLCELYYPDAILDVNEEKVEVGIYKSDYLVISIHGQNLTTP